jgi:hypothetical protein
MLGTNGQIRRLTDGFAVPCPHHEPVPRNQTAIDDVAIHLESRQPMCGSLQVGSGRRVKFVGWLALMAALDRIFGETPVQGDPLPAEHRGGDAVAAAIDKPSPGPNGGTRTGNVPPSYVRKVRMFSARPRLLVAAAAVALILLGSLAAFPARATEPQVIDPADDAYRYPNTPLGQREPKPPMPLLSNTTADVISAAFAKTSPAQRGQDGAYTVSVRLTGEPKAAFNYIVGAKFGEDCWLIHFLTPGQTRKARAGCGQGDQYRSVGSFAGSTVAGRNKTVSATFTFRRFLMPSALKADPVLGPFFVLTCPARGTDKWACEAEDLLDYAWSEGTFGI